MARGNLFLGTARGSLGDITLYRYDSEQVSRIRVRRIKNPQTIEQVVPRIILTTISKAYSAMSMICNDSFQDYSGNEKNMRRFLKLNNAWLKEQTYYYYYGFKDKTIKGDFSGNYNLKDQVKMVINPYIISEGDLPSVGYNLCDPVDGLKLPVGANQEITYQQMCDLLNVPQGAQLTLVQLIGDSDSQIVDRMLFSRVILYPNNGNMSTLLVNNGAVRNPNARNEGEMTINSTGSDGNYSYLFKIPYKADYPTQSIMGAALIVSYYENKKWRRSSQAILPSNAALIEHDELGALISMSDALESWRKNVNSSLYLNQANEDDTSTQALGLRNAESSALDEIPDTDTKRKRRSNPQD